MKQQLNNRSIFSTIGKLILQILSNWVAISIFCLAIWGLLTRILFQLQIESNMSKPILLLIIAQTGLTITSLALSTFCIIRIHKNKSLLPPTKEREKILLFALKNDNFHIANLDIELYKAIVYVDMLTKAFYLIHVLPFENGIQVDKGYSITKDGLKYLRKNNLIGN